MQLRQLTELAHSSRVLTSFRCCSIINPFCIDCRSCVHCGVSWVWLQLFGAALIFDCCTRTQWNGTWSERKTIKKRSTKWKSRKVAQCLAQSFRPFISLKQHNAAFVKRCFCRKPNRNCKWEDGTAHTHTCWDSRVCVCVCVLHSLEAFRCANAGSVTCVRFLYSVEDLLRCLSAVSSFSSSCAAPWQAAALVGVWAFAFACVFAFASYLS